MTLIHRSDGLYLRTRHYVLWLPEGRPYAVLADADGCPWAELMLASSLHTTDHLDETWRLHRPRVQQTEDTTRIEIDAESSAWRTKRTVLDCTEEEVRWNVEVEGEGRLADVHLLGGHYSGDLGFGSGFHQSGFSFASVVNPEPWGSERRARPAAESTILDVLGSSVPGKEHWLFTPPPLCLAVSRSPAPAAAEELPDGPWMAIGVGAPAGEHTFTALHYDAVEGAFSLRLTYEGQTRVDGRFTSPTITFHPGVAGPYDGIATHTASLRRLGWLPEHDRPPAPDWWHEPIFCGWGSQCVHSALEGGHPQGHATAELYDELLADLARRDLVPRTVVLDDKWQRTYGSWEADPAKWPDLAGWIARRHEAGQRVLLWWKAWDPEGLPAERCVRNLGGEPLAVDPTHPGYEADLRASVRMMLGPEGYDADGFKVDFSARTPSGPSLIRYGDDWGMELLHRLLWILYDEAKRTKPEALVMTHTPHPAFVDVTDMIRLNDVNTRAAVVPQMRHRAAVARAACPELLIDTDNWPMPDPSAFRAYVTEQPSLGVPSLYYATHLDDQPPWSKGYGHAGGDGLVAALREDGFAVPDRQRGRAVAMTEEDDDVIRRAWSRARARSSAPSSTGPDDV